MAPFKALYWHPAGPLVTYGAGTFYVADLNPENEIHFRMSRWEVIKLGASLIYRAMISAATEQEKE